MKISEVKVGNVLTIIGSNKKYAVTDISGDVVRLESARIVAGMTVLLHDLPEIFEGWSDEN